MRPTPQRGTCTVEGCPAPAVKRQMCSAHYQAWRTRQKPSAATRACTLPDCQRRHHARGFCEVHYRRWRRHGDPRHRPRTRHPGPGQIVPPAHVKARVFTVRLDATEAAWADYAAATHGMTRAEWLRHAINEATGLSSRDPLPR